MLEFLKLPETERQAFLFEAEAHFKRPAQILEKDIWVCWALESLFRLKLPMVFKGGTSLSKVYRSIARFSEDLDITIDHAASGDLIVDPLAESLSNTKRRAFSDRMQGFTKNQVRDLIQPHFEQLKEEFPIRNVSTNEDGDSLLVDYISVFPASNYLLSRIKLEFGARNAIEPSASHVIEPDVLDWEASRQFKFPSASVPVLLGERTFWEKATLIHAEISRKNLKSTMARYSRHWYDLSQLAQHQIGIKALERPDLRDHVIRTKTALFGVAGVDYRLVASGQCQLMPQGDLNMALEQDYNAMIEASMFDGTPPSWAEILLILHDLEQRINSDHATA